MPILPESSTLHARSPKTIPSTFSSRHKNITGRKIPAHVPGSAHGHFASSISGNPHRCLLHIRRRPSLSRPLMAPLQITPSHLTIPSSRIAFCGLLSRSPSPHALPDHHLRAPFPNAFSASQPCPSLQNRDAHFSRRATFFQRKCGHPSRPPAGQQLRPRSRNAYHMRRRRFRTRLLDGPTPVWHRTIRKGAGLEHHQRFRTFIDMGKAKSWPHHPIPNPIARR